MSKNNTPINIPSTTSVVSDSKRQYPRTNKTAKKLDLSAGTCLTTKLVDEYYKGMPAILEHCSTGKYPVSDWLTKNGLMECASALHIALVSLWNTLQQLGEIRDREINGELFTEGGKAEYDRLLSGAYNDLNVIFSFDDNIRMYEDYPVEMLYSMRAWSVIDRTAIGAGTGKASNVLRQGAVSYVTFRNEMFREIIKRYNKMYTMPSEVFSLQKDLTKARRTIKRGQRQLDNVNTLIATLEKYIDAVDNDDVKSYLNNAMSKEVEKRDKLKDSISNSQDLYDNAQTDLHALVEKYESKKAAVLASTTHFDK